MYKKKVYGYMTTVRPDVVIKNLRHEAAHL